MNPTARARRLAAVPACGGAGHLFKPGFFKALRAFLFFVPEGRQRVARDFNPWSDATWIAKLPVVTLP